MQELKPDDVAFLARTKIDPVRASGELALGYSSRDPCGRAVRKDPETYEEAVEQLDEHKEEMEVYVDQEEDAADGENEKVKKMPMN